jgi:hypothetical protein
MSECPKCWFLIEPSTADFPRMISAFLLFLLYSVYFSQFACLLEMAFNWYSLSSVSQELEFLYFN